MFYDTRAVELTIADASLTPGGALHLYSPRVGFAEGKRWALPPVPRAGIYIEVAHEQWLRHGPGKYRVTIRRGQLSRQDQTVAIEFMGEPGGIDLPPSTGLARLIKGALRA